MGSLGEKRLAKEYLALMKEPLEFIIAHPEEDNIFMWHYVITGPPDSPFSGGQYHGTMKFPRNYPFAAPAIQMETPNGRYHTKVNICLTMSNYHPETWLPTWNPSSILLGLLSHMLDFNDLGYGTTKNSKEAIGSMAKLSRLYNNSQKSFRRHFPEIYEENEAILAKKRIDNQQKPDTVTLLPKLETKPAVIPVQQQKRAKFKQFFKKFKKQ